MRGIGYGIMGVAAVVATGAGTVYSPTMENQTIQIDGITTATVVIQVSEDNSNWYIAKDAFDGTAVSHTSDAINVVAGPFRYIRANVTAWTSGAITVTALI